MLQALEENIRLDARPLDALRKIEISFGEEFGVVDVQLGRTRCDRPRGSTKIHWSTY